MTTTTADLSTLNREGWLTEVAKACERFFVGYEFPRYRVTCGWPMASGRPNGGVYRVGECHGAKSSKGGVFEIFISPTTADPLEVTGIVMHEMAHVLAGMEAKHGPKFVRVCNHAHLTKGAATQRGPGRQLEGWLKELLKPLPPYPHDALVPVGKSVIKPSGSVTLRCSECGFRATTSIKWLDGSGYPTCGCGTQLTEKERAQDR